ILTYLPRSLFPPFGSWLGYRWFVNIVNLPEGIFDCDRHLDDPTHADYLESTRRWMDRPIMYGIAGIATLYIAYDYYLSDRANMLLLENWMLLAGNLLWWYFLIRVLEMTLIFLWNLKDLLGNPDLRAKIDIDFFDEKNLYGFKPIVRYIYWFTLLYVVIIGLYLSYYQFLDLFVEKNQKSVLSVTIWLCYFLVPLYSYFTTLHPILNIFNREKQKQLNQYADEMKESETSKAYARYLYYKDKYETLDRVQFLNQLYSFKRNLLIQSAIVLGNNFTYLVEVKNEIDKIIK
ncbi:MAG: hypothetical protein AB4290_02185, partial [Spirulina sp.]